MEHHRTTLPGGLRIIQAHVPGVRSVAITIYVGLGSRYESAQEAGVSHLIEHMLFKGTERRPSAGQIAETLESVGGILNASTDKEVTLYWAKVAGEHLPIAVDLLADMLRHSRLSPVDLAREKRVVLEELGMLLDDPQDWVHTLADEALWPNQPLGREIAGTRQSVQGLRGADLRRFMRRYYGPNNAVVSVAGGMDYEHTVRLLVQHLGDWEPVSPRPAPEAVFAAAGSRCRLEYKATEQVNLCVAYPAISRRHPDRWALDVLATILGGGTSSRLFVQLRERQGLAYDVHAYPSFYGDTGSFVVYAGSDAAKTNRVLDEIFRAVERLQRRRVLERELQNAKRYFRGRLWLGLEDTQAVAGWFGIQEMLHHGVITPEQAAEAVDAVTADDLRRVARTYLQPPSAYLAAVGPLADASLERQLLGA